MPTLENNVPGLVSIGQKLLTHSRAAEFTAKRGMVVALFPFFYGASQRMSARAISRFLEKEQKVKLSAVTITKALNDPKKSWNQFFDIIEPAARVFHRATTLPMREFLFKDKNIKDPKGLVYRTVSRTVLGSEAVQADLFLREKWFSIDLEIRLKALPYLEHRLGK